MSHRLPLGETLWSVWRDVVLRTAGFPAVGLDAFAAPDAADALLAGEVAAEVFDKALAVALADASATAGRIAADPLLREAVTWQNLEMVAESGLVGVTGEAERFLAVRRWPARLGLPERVFVKVGTEVKPCYVDLTGALYAQSLCAMVNAAARSGPDVTVVVGELLPAPTDCWVTDARGRAYVSELRLQITDPMTYPGEHR
ncbi:hypothetical protein [Micromonospora cremea]|uniref:Uncharacterized protein n=1 Tax=Micromonospora cremea TaxID=709881 RepID=A0A1N5UQ92_9ACTN|nr:hypothetical protein [Micromonospora cremea]SIM62558.1 hypothetical protein SAMN04489832_1068 [Micromonospora cremea]